MLVGDAPRSDAYRFQILLPFLVGLSSGSTTFLQDALYRHNRRGLVVGSFVISCRSAIAWTKCRSWLFQGGKHRFTYTPKKPIAQDSSRVKSSRHILEPITILKNLSRWARSRTKTMTSESEKSPNGKGLTNAERRNSRVKISVRRKCIWQGGGNIQVCTCMSPDVQNTNAGRAAYCQKITKYQTTQGIRL